jgi:VIT1/CCC1 family predicted Fe2+/Mn2+ transporter
LRGQGLSSAEDEDTAKTLDLLLKSMSDAEAERDSARIQADLYRAQAQSLEESEAFHIGENAGLVEQLRASASRVDALAAQVRIQLESNRALRERLAEAVGRGEREQKTSASRINSMQGKLKALEDKLMTAQQHSEEAFAQHEEEVREIQDSHNMQLQRLKNGLRTPIIFSPMLPKSPMFSPRLKQTSSGLGISMTEAVKTDTLERKVSELEGALGDADREMEQVISRMNRAQIEVMDLQTAR